MAGKIKLNKQEQYNLLADLMRYIPDVIYFKDRSGRLLLVNETHARGLGLKPQEVAGKTDFDIFPKQRALAMAKDDQHVMTTGKAVIDKIERSTRADGVDNYVSTTKIPRYDEKGSIIGLIGITRDITRRMRYEQSKRKTQGLEKKLEALEELSRLKSEFISIVSHELRTPLAIIKEAVMLLLDEIAGGLNEKQKHILQKAKDNIQRLKGIIEELLDISRIESGKLKLHYSLVNLNDLLKESADFFKKLAAEKSVGLTYVLPQEEVNLLLDSDKIHRVITNLLSNAIKFTEEYGSIKAELKIFHDRVRLGVTDSGIGIAGEDLPKLFNKFSQVSKISSIERKGLGLGLSIARELVEAQGGEIWAESKVGVGSKFYFTLPRLPGLENLDKATRDRLKALLSRGRTLYFIQLNIINYKEFSKSLNSQAKELFSALAFSADKTLRAYFSKVQEKTQIGLAAPRYGQCGFFLPGVSEKAAELASRMILRKLRIILAAKKIKNVFINMGALYPEREDFVSQAAVRQSFEANLRVRKICIGRQTRKFQRLAYKVDIQLVLPSARRISASTIDLSSGGLSFYSPEALKTDAHIEVVMRFPREKEPLFVNGRIAWIKQIRQGESQYKIGLEFINLDALKARIISRSIGKYIRPRKICPVGK